MRELVKCPLPGKLIEYSVKEGDLVKKGDVLVIVESMKMFNEICSDHDGTIIKLFAEENSHVPVSETLLEIEV